MILLPSALIYPIHTREEKDMTFGFIGSGNMGGAIATAVCKAVDPQTVLLANRTAEKAERLAAALGCRTGSNEDAAKCDFIFLGVKPYFMEEMLGRLKTVLAGRTDPFVLVTMAAGLTVDRIREMAGGSYPVIRIMPNTPAAYGAGMIQYCQKGVSREAMEAFLSAMAPAGLLDEIPENLIDAASSVSGCGPAWVCQFLEAMADGGVACGLPRAKAIAYAAQMMLGTAKMVLESGDHPGALKDAVCSPGGSTIQGVRTLEQNGFRGAVMDAVIAAFEKNKEMGKN